MAYYLLFLYAVTIEKKILLGGFKMKRFLIVAIALFFLLSSFGLASAITFTPEVPDLYDLAHDCYYTWGIDWQLPDGAHIEEASITFHNIYDWTVEDDVLYVHLLDDMVPGVSQCIDDPADGDYFDGQVPLYTWSDPIGGWVGRTDITFEIDPEYFSWLSDGNFGFGIDPDCHYRNDEVTMTIITPEPITVILLGFGLLGLGVVTRRKS